MLKNRPISQIFHMVTPMKFASFNARKSKFACKCKICMPYVICLTFKNTYRLPIVLWMIVKITDLSGELTCDFEISLLFFQIIHNFFWLFCDWNLWLDQKIWSKKRLFCVFFSSIKWKNEWFGHKSFLGQNCPQNTLEIWANIFADFRDFWLFCI